jgi:hypothetical protein
VITLGLTLTIGHATVFVGPWAPVFKGIDHARGQMLPSGGDLHLQAVNALRIDLSDPEIRLFPMPRCTNCPLETISTAPSQFLTGYGLQVAVNCSFSDSVNLIQGVPRDVLGLAISQGDMVSPAATDENTVVLLFTTDNQPVFLPTNVPPTNTVGIYNAVSGDYPLVVHGANVAVPTDLVLNPRTAVGVSQDRRYLYFLTIDGRSPGYSDGATHYETAEWLLRFGAYHGMNVDGGSSASMVMSDGTGAAVFLNRNSYMQDPNYHGRDPGVGHLFGVYAPPHPFIHDVTLSAADTTATLLWKTAAEATAQVEYGSTTRYGSTTPLYGSLSPLNSIPMTNHVVTLNGLTLNTSYYFRLLSTAGGTNYARPGWFRTTAGVIFDLTNPWRYTTNNLDGVNWQAPAYNDAAWLGPAPALLFAETNAAVEPRNTALPTNSTVPYVRPTCYFRSHFNFTGDPQGVSLTLFNHIDDGAVFYLNGLEICRLRMPPPPTAITYTTYATGTACSNYNYYPYAGDACTNCPDLITVPASLVTDLRQGDNVLAVEVHNNSLNGNDLVFGTALFYSRPYPEPLELRALRSGDVVMLHWNGSGLTLQETAELRSTSIWTDVPGPVTASPYLVTNGTTRFYRLRN